MRERYGLDQRRWRLPVAIGAGALAFAGVIAALTLAQEQRRVDVTLLSWQERDDHATVTFEVRRAGGAEARCVVRGQDRTRTDVGYAEVTVPAGAPAQVVTYELATLMPAFTVEVLGCSIDGDPRVPPPQFPPGVAAPEQPFAG